jgi:hypothetical protein
MKERSSARQQRCVECDFDQLSVLGGVPPARKLRVLPKWVPPNGIAEGVSSARMERTLTPKRQ